MGIKGKRGTVELMNINFAEILLFALAFIVFIAGTMTAYTLLTTSPEDQQIEDQFNAFTSMAEAITYSNSQYASSYVQVMLKENFYLVGFPGAVQEVIALKQGNTFKIQRPPKCDPLSSCICLYSDEPVYAKPKKNLIECKDFSDIDFITMHEFGYTNLYSVDGTPINFDIFPGTIASSIGESMAGSSDAYISSFYSYVNSFFDTKRDIAAKEETLFLGLEGYAGRDLNYFVVKAHGTGAIPLYLELMNDDNKKALVFFHYNRGLYSRKNYFVKKPSDAEICNNKYIYSVFEEVSDPGKYYYCNPSGSKLIPTTVKIEPCAIGPITETCVCGSRAVNSGFCSESTNGKQVFINLPEADTFCEVNPAYINDCGRYTFSGEEICVLDPCSLNQAGCIWITNSCENR